MTRSTALDQMVLKQCCPSQSVALSMSTALSVCNVRKEGG